MNEQKVFFGVSKKLIERIDSLDQKWYVEIWIIKYFFLGIEIHSWKKEIIKHTHQNLDDLKVVR